MSTRKNRLVIITMRFGLFRLPIILPMRCVHEIVEGFLDFLSLLSWAGKKVFRGVKVAEAALIAIKDYGPLDLVNVDIKSPDARVKVKMQVR